MTKLLRQLVVLAWMLCMAWVPAHAQTTPAPPKILVLYDTPSGNAYDKIGFAYAIMLRNLLGHFDAQVTTARVKALRSAIEAGKHVYTEKPTAETLAEAVELARRADAAGVKHGVVQDKLFLPGLKKRSNLQP